MGKGRFIEISKVSRVDGIGGRGQYRKEGVEEQPRSNESLTVLETLCCVAANILLTAEGAGEPL